MVLMTDKAIATDELMKRAQTVFKPIPATPPVLEEKPITPAKIELGKMLYFVLLKGQIFFIDFQKEQTHYQLMQKCLLL
jgi:hypothetical protein